MSAPAGAAAYLALFAKGQDELRRLEERLRALLDELAEARK